MIVCIGEIVWDIFPEDYVLGGAPLNVAYHLKQMRNEIIFVSRIGNDILGKKTIQQLKSMDVETDFIQTDEMFPTGKAKVIINNNTNNFDITYPCAWDNIEMTKIKRPYHIVFGTLAQRDERSRQTIRKLAETADLKFYDVNLRPPFTPKEIVIESFHLADIVKINDDELMKVSSWLDIKETDLEKSAKKIMERFGLNAIAVTRGDKGAFVVVDEGIYSHGGFHVDVIDTVGSGDAFFATFIDGYLKNKPMPTILEDANRRASFVATRKGATPIIPDDLS